MVIKEPNELFIGTLNCRGLSRKAKKEQLTNDITHFKLDITAVQETKIKGSDDIEYLQPNQSIWNNNT